MASIRESIIDRLNSFDHIPSINKTAREVQELLSRGADTILGAAAIGKIIEKDIGLTAKILKIANSVFYSGRYGPIGNVGQAVTRMGIEELSRICAMVSGLQVFSGTVGNIDLKEFWKHSIGVAIVMRHIAEKSDKMLPRSFNAYTAGLFHDIGILLFDRYFSDIFKKVLDAGNKESLPLFQSERRILEIDHGEIGSLLCKKWRFPEDICQSIAWHHTPDTCPEQFRLLSQLIHIANFVCSVLGIPEPGDNAIQMGSAGAWHDLGLDKCDFNLLAEIVEEGISRSGEFVTLSL
jgi:putative nucleotidyltransferase with HDIG domain